MLAFQVQDCLSQKCLTTFIIFGKSTVQLDATKSFTLYEIGVLHARRFLCKRFSKFSQKIFMLQLHFSLILRTFQKHFRDVAQSTNRSQFSNSFLSSVPSPTIKNKNCNLLSKYSTLTGSQPANAITDLAAGFGNIYRRKQQARAFMFYTVLKGKIGSYKD